MSVTTCQLITPEKKFYSVVVDAYNVHRGTDTVVTHVLLFKEAASNNNLVASTTWVRSMYEEKTSTWYEVVMLKKPEQVIQKGNEKAIVKFKSLSVLQAMYLLKIRGHNIDEFLFSPDEKEREAAKKVVGWTDKEHPLATTSQ